MPNRLANETSPYLQQHADNPVDWYPWGEEALQLAREQDKPILLSVGYSACHWCHVMAHESFEDAGVAAEMNRHFVNIKVDREERPDLDQIYQTAHAMLTQRSGGWPLTMFLTPAQEPFFGGTYFPRQSRYGLPGFKDLLPRIATAYREQQADIAQQNAALRDALTRMLPAVPHGVTLDTAPLAAGIKELARIFDDAHGGLGNAPKFPHPFELGYCLRRHALDRDATALQIAEATLTRMAQGGIYDQLGGGFCRYSVDRHWSIPHFEKMLYDNGPLVALYADLWCVTRNPLFARIVEETAGWVLREMQSPEGGYYSTLDADSEHEEGKFYVWTPHAVQALLTADEYAVTAPHYGLDGGPNFEGAHWHLRVAQSLASVAQHLGRDVESCEQLLACARAKLLAARETRVHPGRDEKILTSWNGLMIRGMARVARVFDRPEWLASAQRAADFVRTTLWRDERLLATYKSGRAHLNAYLDDYAFMLDALLELMQTRFRSEDLAFARQLASALLARFEDRAAGGFFFTGHDHEPLFHRPKPGHDNATPSGNGIAAFALQRLGHLVGEPRYLAAAERALKLFWPMLGQQPSGHVSFLAALDEYLAPPTIAILRGAEPELDAWQKRLTQHYAPSTLIVAVPDGMRELPATLDKPAAERVNGWVCQGVNCLPPIAELDRLIRVLIPEPSTRS